MANAMSGRDIARGARIFQAVIAARDARKAARLMSEAVGVVNVARRARGLVAFFSRSTRTKQACQKASQAFDDLTRKLEDAGNKARAAFTEAAEEAKTVVHPSKVSDEQMIGFRAGVEARDGARADMLDSNEKSRGAIAQIERARTFALDAAAKFEKAAKSGLAEDFAEAEAAAAAALKEAEWANTAVETAANTLRVSRGGEEISGLVGGVGVAEVAEHEKQEAAEVFNPFGAVVPPEKQDQWIDGLVVPAVIQGVVAYETSIEEARVGDDGRGSAKLKAPPQHEPLPEVCCPLPSLTSENPEKPFVPSVQGASDEVWSVAAGKQQSVEAFTEDSSIAEELSMPISR
ncbi:MAG: hypothetical protein K1X66_01545 [Verrucomicrobiae bacterium]|nr:hypothetical protein [Verrucomicrobiae bacterium]